MIRYATYHKTTGEIYSWGYGASAPDDADYVEHDILDSLAEYKVDPLAKLVVPKDTMSLTLPGPTPADGESEAVVAGLPVGTVCEFFFAGSPQRLVVTDGTLELTFEDPITLWVTFWHPTYRHDPVEVTFV